MPNSKSDRMNRWALQHTTEVDDILVWICGTRVKTIGNMCLNWKIERTLLLVWSSNRLKKEDSAHTSTRVQFSYLVNMLIFKKDWESLLVLFWFIPICACHRFEISLLLSHGPYSLKQYSQNLQLSPMVQAFKKVVKPWLFLQIFDCRSFQFCFSFIV